MLDRQRVSISLIAFVSVYALSSFCAAADLQVVVESAEFAEVVSANDKGVLVVRRELMDDGILSLFDVLWTEKSKRLLPTPSGYTHLELIRVTAAGDVLVVARRPPQDRGENQRSYVWRLGASEPERLPIPAGFRDAIACDISQDGTTVSGYVLGRTPPRFLPCVWTCQAAKWDAQVLDAPFAENPLLTTAHCVVSDNGQLLAATLVDSITDSISRYALFVWRRNPSDDTWQREKVLDRAVHIAGMTDQGLIAGRVTDVGHRVAMVYSLGDRKLVTLMPPDCQNSVATGINHHGTVVGFADRGRNAEGVTQAFIWRDGRFLDLSLPSDAISSKANCITPEGRIGGTFERSVAQPDDSVTTTNAAFLSEVEPTIQQ